MKLTAALTRALNGRSQKFNAKKASLDGYTFDSLKERDRYVTLRLEQRAGLIHSLVVHPRYVLLGWSATGPARVGRFTPDFEYRRDGVLVAEDVKSPPTRRQADYRLRKHLFEANQSRKLQEV